MEPLPCFPFNFKQNLPRQGTGFSDHPTLFADFSYRYESRDDISSGFVHASFPHFPHRRAIQAIRLRRVQRHRLFARLLRIRGSRRKVGSSALSHAATQRRLGRNQEAMRANRLSRLTGTNPKAFECSCDIRAFSHHVVCVCIGVFSDRIYSGYVQKVQFLHASFFIQGHIHQPSSGAS